MTKYKILKNVPNTTGSKNDFFLVVLGFYEHIHLGANQSLRSLLCFSSRCEDLIRT